MITTTRVRPFHFQSPTQNASFKRNGVVCTWKHFLHQQTLRNDQECDEQRKTRNPGGHLNWAPWNTPIQSAPPNTHNSPIRDDAASAITTICSVSMLQTKATDYSNHVAMTKQTVINTDCISPLSSPSNILRSPPSWCLSSENTCKTPTRRKGLSDLIGLRSILHHQSVKVLSVRNALRCAYLGAAHLELGLTIGVSLDLDHYEWVNNRPTKYS